MYKSWVNCCLLLCDISAEGRLPVRLVLASLFSYSFNKLAYSIQKTFSVSVRVWFTLLSLSSFHIPYYAGRTLPNFMALPGGMCPTTNVDSASVITYLVLTYNVLSIMEYLACHDCSNCYFRGGQSCQPSQGCHCPHCASYDRPPRTRSLCYPPCSELADKRASRFRPSIKMGYPRRVWFFV